MGRRGREGLPRAASDGLPGDYVPTEITLASWFDADLIRHGTIRHKSFFSKGLRNSSPLEAPAPPIPIPDIPD
mgnify:CR=1 FL=1